MGQSKNRVSIGRNSHILECIRISWKVIIQQINLFKDTQSTGASAQQFRGLGTQKWKVKAEYTQYEL